MSTTAVLTPERAEELCGDGMFSVEEAAAFANWSRAELYVRMGRGEVPFVKDGKRRTIPKRALVEILAQKLIATPQV